MTSKHRNDKEAHHLLKKLVYVAGGSVAGSHQWLWEGERWKELVFALLTQVSAIGEDATRELTDQLYQLELLDVATLAGSRRKARKDETASRRITAIMREAGMNKDEAALGLATISEAAFGLTAKHGGKIQLYLRAHAQRMVDEAQKVFGLSALKDREARKAITYWLQNVANMPLSLQDKAIDAFAGEHGVSGAELYAAADELDLNVALLDDLVAEAYVAYVTASPAEVESAVRSAPAGVRTLSRSKRAPRKTGVRNGR